MTHERRDALEAPFDGECASMARARHAASAFARTSVPIFVRGESGTGRRTLARQIALARGATASALAVIVPGDRAFPVAELAALKHVIVERPSELSRGDQNALVEATRAGLRLHTWGDDQVWKALDQRFRTALAAGEIALPPLRERGSEIVCWSRHFAALHSSGTCPRLSEEQESFVAAQRWTGNLPQLERYVVDALSFDAGYMSTAWLPAGAATVSVPFKIETLTAATKKFREEYIQRVLKHFGGNRTQAARAMNVDPRTIFRHLEKK